MKKQKQNEPKQKTKEGHEIPIPKRGDFLKNLKKVAKASTGNDAKE